MKGVILSGGRGTRLRPITHTGPKQLIPVANKPVLEYAIEDLKDAGITDIGIVLGNVGREEIQKHIADGSKLGVSITYIVQGNPLGLAHAVGCARDFVGDDDFVVYLGDNITKFGINALVERFQRGSYAATVAVQEVDNPSRFGIVELDKNGEVVSFVEKPENPPTNLALIGTFVFSPDIFGAIKAISPSDRGELEITDAIHWLLQTGHSIDPHIVEGWWKDTGKPEDILEANRFLLDQIESCLDGSIGKHATVSGIVEVKKGATIESGAVVRGPVSIDQGSLIKDGTYIGPYTSIGPDTMVKNSHIENSVVIGESEIETNENIVDSIIGRRTVIESREEKLPDGNRLVVGKGSQLGI
ncbi:glucose-1-phosphate thymidylyltransferase [Haloarcula halophila]|uniref:glucose-1-phosphate thymidylyltransferase n=1 Tax=Haloarcula TaxID=2237 RepID=UPI0023E40CDA|nr:glucose-1-phosphate thymidylyltransferase [Halomicroarcula sp. DFY41]